MSEGGEGVQGEQRVRQVGGKAIIHRTESARGAAARLLYGGNDAGVVHGQDAVVQVANNGTLCRFAGFSAEADTGLRASQWRAATSARARWPPVPRTGSE